MHTIKHFQPTCELHILFCYRKHRFSLMVSRNVILIPVAYIKDTVHYWCAKDYWCVTVGVSQLMHKITNLKKTPLLYHGHTKLCAFRSLISRPQILNLRSRNQTRGKSLLSRKRRHFRGSCFAHNILYYQPLPITHDQVRFYANNYFE